MIGIRKYGNSFGFEIEFENGYSIDIINGFGSYSDNQYVSNLGDEAYTGDCEIAVKHHKELVNPFGWDDTVLGFVSAEQLADYIIKVKELKGD